MVQKGTLERIRARLNDVSWPTAAELALDLRLSARTVRGYLMDLVVAGEVQRWADESVPSPRGYAYRFNLLAEPLGLAMPTGDLLCDTCATEEYGDLLRYQRALTRDEYKEIGDLDNKAYDRYLAQTRCERCGNLRYP